MAFVVLPAIAQEPVQRPDVKVGDRWGYRLLDLSNGTQIGSSEMIVASVGSDVIQVVAHRGSNSEEVDATFTTDWNQVNAVNGAVFVPHTGIFRFPLRVGSTYAADYEVLRPRQGAFRSRIRLNVTVVGWEDVVVPAGRFRALKVEGIGTFERQDMQRSGSMRQIFWYAPEVKRWVKSEIESSNPESSNLKGKGKGKSKGQSSRRERLELVAYSPAG